MMISGTYRRPYRPEAETMRECPVIECNGGEIRYEVETETTYSVTIEDCEYCGGTGVVPKSKVA